MTTRTVFNRSDFASLVNAEINNTQQKAAPRVAHVIRIVDEENAAQYTLEYLKQGSRWNGLTQVFKETELWPIIENKVRESGKNRGTNNDYRNVHSALGQLASYLVASATISIAEIGDLYAVATKCFNKAMGIGIAELTSHFNGEGSTASQRAAIFGVTTKILLALVDGEIALGKDERFVSLTGMHYATLTKNLSEAESAFAAMGKLFLSQRNAAKRSKQKLDVQSRNWLTWPQMLHFKGFVEARAQSYLVYYAQHGRLSLKQATAFHGVFSCVVLFSVLGQRPDVMTGMTVELMDADADLKAAAYLTGQDIADLADNFDLNATYVFQPSGTEKVPRIRKRNEYLSFGNGAAATFLLMSRQANKCGHFYITTVRPILIDAWGGGDDDNILFRLPATPSPATASSLSKNLNYWLESCFGRPCNVSFRSLRRNFITIVVLLYTTGKGFHEFESLVDLKKALSASLNTSVNMLDEHYIAHSRFTNVAEGAAETRLATALGKMLVRAPLATDRDIEDLAKKLSETEMSYPTLEKSSKDDLHVLLSSSEHDLEAADAWLPQIGSTLLNVDSDQDSLDDDLDFGDSEDFAPVTTGGSLPASATTSTSRIAASPTVPSATVTMKTRTSAMPASVSNKLLSTPVRVDKGKKRQRNDAELGNVAKSTPNRSQVPPKKPSVEYFHMGARVHALVDSEGNIAGYRSNDPSVGLITVEQYAQAAQK